MLLNNYVGQIKEKSIELIETIIDQLLIKILQIPIPQSNTSEIEKIQIKVLQEFMRLISKITGEYTSSIFLTQKNFPYLQGLIDMIIQLMDKGIDQTIKKIALVLLK